MMLHWAVKFGELLSRTEKCLLLALPRREARQVFLSKVFTILNITIMTNKIEDIDNITVKEIFVQLGIGAAMGCALIAACCLGGWLNHFFS